jgi:hypothetical protein
MQFEEYYTFDGAEGAFEMESEDRILPQWVKERTRSRGSALRATAGASGSGCM